MEIVERLKTLSDKELKEYLAQQKIIKEGAIVQFPISNTLDNISEVLYTYRRKYKKFNPETGLDEDTIGIWGITSKEPGQVFKLSPANDVRLLTYDVYKGLLFSNMIEKASIDSIIKYLHSATASFGKDNVEIIEMNKNLVNVTLYFPELVIKNSLDMEHSLLDVYLTFVFRVITDSISKYTKINLHDMYFWRGKYTLAEYRANYMFSHVGGNSSRYAYGKNLGDFCLGGSNILSSFIDKSRAKIELTNIPSLFHLFLEYMKWESIEGVPYRFLTDIKKFNIRPKYISSENLRSKVINLYKTFLGEDTLPQLHYNINTDRQGEVELELTYASKDYVNDKINEIVFGDTEGFEEIIGKLAGSNFGEIVPLSPLNPDELEWLENNNKETTFIFNGESLDVEIIDNEDKIDLSKFPDVIHPKVVELVVGLIEAGLTNVFKSEKLKNE